MAEYRLTPAAERDLEAIWLYTLSEWDEEQANRYIDLMASAFSELAQFPKIAPSCYHIHPGYRRLSVERHVIYYRVTAYGVAIIRVLHDRMDALRHI
jgi:toxin ParE1/3/4